MHAFHTLDVELNRDVKVEKTCWDEAYLDRLRAAAAASKNVRCLNLPPAPYSAYLGVNDAYTPALLVRKLRLSRCFKLDTYFAVLLFAAPGSVNAVLVAMLSARHSVPILRLHVHSLTLLPLPSCHPVLLSCICGDPQSDLVAIVMDIGIAHVCSISEHMTLERARIDVPVPKKRAGGSGYQVWGRPWCPCCSCLLRRCIAGVVLTALPLGRDAPFV